MVFSPGQLAKENLFKVRNVTAEQPSGECCSGDIFPTLNSFFTRNNSNEEENPV